MSATGQLAFDRFDALLDYGLMAPQSSVAIVDDETIVTYGKLRVLVSEVVQMLRRSLPEGEALIAVEVDRSWRLVVACLAIVRAGFAFAVIDKNLPESRKEAMISSASLRYLLSWSAGDEVSMTVLEAVKNEIDPCQYEKRLAYVVFTSGSTGSPKAVGIERHSLLDFVAWHIATYGQPGGWRAAQIASPMFDVFVWDVFGSICGRAQLDVISDNDRDPYTLWQRIAEVDVAHAPTPIAHLLLAEEDMQPSQMRLRDLLTGGERLNARPQLKRSYRFNDHYGPSECTIIVTSTIAHGDVACVPRGVIGPPVASQEIYVVDEHQRPVASGELGELLICGSFVGRGYLGNPSESAKHFIDFPHASCRAYRTGDFGRIVDDLGSIEFHGRRDHQVKINGFRIELGDVEAAVRGCIGVVDAVAGVREGTGGPFLICAVMTSRHSPTDIEAIMRHLRSSLPEYMIPKKLHMTSSLTMGASGKIDRKTALNAIPT